MFTYFDFRKILAFYLRTRKEEISFLSVFWIKNTVVTAVKIGYGPLLFYKNYSKKIHAPMALENLSFSPEKKQPRPIIMDCDPGNDDAVSMLLSLASPEDFNVLGVTCVGGNVPLDQVCINARQICELAGRPDMPVYAGCQGPLIKEYVTDGVHGDTGLDGADLPAPTMPLQKTHAVNFLIETIKNHPTKVTLCPTGPLSNIAMALRLDPKIKDNIEEIVLMGGSIASGNITAAAEFNMYADPHSAFIVFESGLKITMLGLDVTHKIAACPEQLAKIRALNNNPAIQVANMLEKTQAFDIENFNTPGRIIHDPCVPIYLIKPELFKTKKAQVLIDIIHPGHMGNTIVSFYKKHTEKANAYVPYDVDHEGVFDIIVDRLGRYTK